MILRLVAKYRRTVFLAGAVLVSLLLLTMEVRREETLTPSLKRLLLESVSPFLDATAHLKRSAGEIGDSHVDLRFVRQEKVRPRGGGEAPRARLGAVEEGQRENQRLKNLLGLREREPFHVVAAGIVGRDATNWFHTLLIDRGLRDGVERHTAVITSAGLVGQVVEASASSARVQLVTDPVSSVGVLLQGSRVTGLLVGGQSGPLRIRYLPVRGERGRGAGCGLWLPALSVPGDMRTGRNLTVDGRR